MAPALPFQRRGLSFPRSTISHGREAVLNVDIGQTVGLNVFPP
jgi:hypothetical protein